METINFKEDETFYVDLERRRANKEIFNIVLKEPPRQESSLWKYVGYECKAKVQELELKGVFNESVTTKWGGFLEKYCYKAVAKIFDSMFENKEEELSSKNSFTCNPDLAASAIIITGAAVFFAIANGYKVELKANTPIGPVALCMTPHKT